MIEKIKNQLMKIKDQWSYGSCYNNQELLGHAIFGNCGGLVGGTSATNYLSENCIGCPYLYLEKDQED